MPTSPAAAEPLRRTSPASPRVAKRPAKPKRPEKAVTPHGRRRAAAQSYPERDQLAVKLLPFVRKVAFEMREHLPQHVEVDELAGAGVLGLLDAVRKFDARKHVKIETYARHRIRGAILDSLREMDTASRDMRRKNKRVERIYREMEAKLGRPVGDDEMARALGVGLKKWYGVVQELNSLGVEWIRPNRIPEMTIIDAANIPAGDDENPFDLCYRQEQRELVSRAAAQLSPRERALLSLYYERGMTMKEIGQAMGVDESRISQIHSAALARLRMKVRKAMQPRRAEAPPAYIVAAPARAEIGVGI